METPRQDGGIGRYTLLPHTTKRKITTNLKTKYNQNCQKTELYGSLMNKELKKKDSFRLVGGAEMHRWGGDDPRQGGSWRTRQTRQWLVDQVFPHLHVANQEEQLGSETDRATQGSRVGK